MLKYLLLCSPMCSSLEIMLFFFSIALLYMLHFFINVVSKLLFNKNLSGRGALYNFVLVPETLGTSPCVG